jgi:tetratricopeptide (TPR) repeat protein
MNNTIEELLDLEEELHSDEKVEKDGTLSQLISVYEALFKKISGDPTSEYAPSLENIKKRLISYLVQYGTYLKTVYQKDDFAAEHCLKKALRYERELPIAHYRLGFLYYKRKNYTTALLHFQNALQVQKRGKYSEYQMNDQQLYNCHLYLANCGLFIAKNSKESLERLKPAVDLEAVPKYEISPLFQMITDIETYLKNHAFRIITNEGSSYGSREDCEDRLGLEQTIILDFTSRENILIFNGGETKLTKNYAELLRYFLIKSNEDTPVTKHEVYDLFGKADDHGEIKTNTFTKNVERLRVKLTLVGINMPVIETKNWRGETAYFYNHRFPFLIMHPIDESFILN